MGNPPQINKELERVIEVWRATRIGVLSTQDDVRSGWPALGAALDALVAKR